MLKEMLKDREKNVYEALYNSIKNDRISSAYLFCGQTGSLKKEAAVLLAETIMCPKVKHDFACESCNTCRRIYESFYPKEEVKTTGALQPIKHADLIYLDGTKYPVSKEDVDAIQEQFSKTSSEEGNGQRVYVIHGAENASIAAQNSMLKFLEEPGKGITAILTVDNIHALLPTIISRCTVLNFKAADDVYLEETAIKKGFSQDEAYLVSHVIQQESDLDAFMQDGETTSLYKNMEGMLEQYLHQKGMRRDELTIDYEANWKSKLKDSTAAKKENMILIRGFLSLLMQYGEDVITGCDKGPSWYHNAVKSASGNKEDYVGLIRIASEERDLCNRYNDLHLIVYQTFYRLEEYNNEHGL